MPYTGAEAESTNFRLQAFDRGVALEMLLRIAAETDPQLAGKVDFLRPELGIDFPAHRVMKALEGYLQCYGAASAVVREADGSPVIRMDMWAVTGEQGLEEWLRNSMLAEASWRLPEFAHNADGAISAAGNHGNSQDIGWRLEGAIRQIAVVYGQNPDTEKLPDALLGELVIGLIKTRFGKSYAAGDLADSGIHRYFVAPHEGRTSSYGQAAAPAVPEQPAATAAAPIVETAAPTQEPAPTAIKDAATLDFESKLAEYFPLLANRQPVPQEMIHTRELETKLGALLASYETRHGVDLPDSLARHVMLAFRHAPEVFEEGEAIGYVRLVAGIDARTLGDDEIGFLKDRIPERVFPVLVGIYTEMLPTLQPLPENYIAENGFEQKIAAKLAAYEAQHGALPEGLANSVLEMLRNPAAYIQPGEYAGYIHIVAGIDAETLRSEEIAFLKDRLTQQPAAAPVQEEATPIPAMVDPQAPGRFRQSTLNMYAVLRDIPAGELNAETIEAAVHPDASFVYYNSERLTELFIEGVKYSNRIDFSIVDESVIKFVFENPGLFFNEQNAGAGYTVDRFIDLLSRVHSHSGTIPPEQDMLREEDGQLLKSQEFRAIFAFGVAQQALNGELVPLDMTAGHYPLRNLVAHSLNNGVENGFAEPEVVQGFINFLANPGAYTQDEAWAVRLIEAVVTDRVLLDLSPAERDFIYTHIPAISAQTHAAAFVGTNAVEGDKASTLGL